MLPYITFSSPVSTRFGVTANASVLLPVKPLLPIALRPAQPLLSLLLDPERIPSANRRAPPFLFVKGNSSNITTSLCKSREDEGFTATGFPLPSPRRLSIKGSKTTRSTFASVYSFTVQSRLSFSSRARFSCHVLSRRCVANHRVCTVTPTSCPMVSPVIIFHTWSKNSINCPRTQFRFLFLTLLFILYAPNTFTHLLRAFFLLTIMSAVDLCTCFPLSSLFSNNCTSVLRWRTVFLRAPSFFPSFVLLSLVQR
ncbi:hypothetical protein TRVL_02440 [Trypanosoma vivax]|nr:hypothetical protein TRVL_02440 [Trypanosoma vivax]